MSQESEDLFDITQKKPDQVSINSPDFIKIYANNAQLGVSLWDMHLVFGEIIGEQDGKPLIEQKVKVNMSKEMAKVLTILLTTNLQAYETQFGEIKLAKPSELETQRRRILASAARPKKQ